MDIFSFSELHIASHFSDMNILSLAYIYYKITVPIEESIIA